MGEGDRYSARGDGCDTSGDPRATPEVIAVIATAAFLLALTQLKTYWLYYGLYIRSRSCSRSLRPPT